MLENGIRPLFADCRLPQNSAGLHALQSLFAGSSIYLTVTNSFSFPFCSNVPMHNAGESAKMRNKQKDLFYSFLKNSATKAGFYIIGRVGREPIAYLSTSGLTVFSRCHVSCILLF